MLDGCLVGVQGDAVVADCIIGDVTEEAAIRT